MPGKEKEKDPISVVTQPWYIFFDKIMCLLGSNQASILFTLFGSKSSNNINKTS
jgi:hypothetical protein